MSPDLALRALAQRHGVPWERARRLLPLMERAAAAYLGLRRDIEAIVDATLGADRVALRLESEERDERALRALAPLLENWRPRDARS